MMQYGARPGYMQKRRCEQCGTEVRVTEYDSHIRSCRGGAGGGAGYGRGPPPRGVVSPRSGGRGPPPRGGAGGGGGKWRCQLCTYENDLTLDKCMMCQQSSRPAGLGGGPPPSAAAAPVAAAPPRSPPASKPPPSKPAGKAKGGKAQPASDYWRCSKCTFLNPQTSVTCVICTQPKPGGGPPPREEPAAPPTMPREQPPAAMAGPPMGGAPRGMGMGGGSYSAYDSRPPPREPARQADYGGSAFSEAPAGGGGGGGGAGGGAVDTSGMDPETAALIKAMMMAENCVHCTQEQGYEVSSRCGHKLCNGCVKSVLLKGIVSKKWEKNPISCFGDGMTCKEPIPQWLIKQSGLGDTYQKQLSEMEAKYLMHIDPSMTQCPKCKEHFATEIGDVDLSKPSKEEGLDGKPLSIEARKHKARWRFRCKCKAIFCGGCKADPYHLGYTCELWKEYQQSKKCRFCESALTPETTAPPDFGSGDGLKAVCTNADCLEKRKWSCDKVHPCEHNCIGIRGERRCIPCFHKDCAPKGADVTSDDFCNICWVDPLFAGPTIQLKCGHFFHFMCVWRKIERKWPAARITFGFLHCPLCKEDIKHEALSDMCNRHYELKDQIQKEAVERLKIEGLDTDTRLTDKASQYFNDMERFAMDRLAFYMCSKCKQPYFGGMKACEEAGMEQEESYKREHLVCGACASGPSTKSCKKHGKKYITYKCKFCCSVANWYCWGNTHFCDDCHKKQEKGTYLNRLPISQLPQCPGPEKCPLGIDHPPNGKEEFSLGCVVCLRK